MLWGRSTKSVRDDHITREGRAAELAPFVLSQFPKQRSPDADLVLNAGASKLRLSQHAFWDDGKGEPLNQTSRITRSEDRCRGAPLGSCRAGVRDFPFSERFKRGDILCLVVGALLGFLCCLVKEECLGEGSF